MKRPIHRSTMLVCALLALAGCAKRKPQIPTAQQQPPSTTTSGSRSAKPPAKAPNEQASQPAPAAGEDSQAAASQQPTGAATAANANAAPRTGHPRQPANKKPEPPREKPSPEVARNAPPKIVIREGGTSAPSNTGVISPGLPHTTAAHDQASTEQLLESTELNLKSLTRQLSSDEQATVAQIRDFVAQSREATKESDLTRAHNLALKAHLLSDDLVRQR